MSVLVNAVRVSCESAMAARTNDPFQLKLHEIVPVSLPHHVFRSSTPETTPQAHRQHRDPLKLPAHGSFSISPAAMFGTRRATTREGPGGTRSFKMRQTHIPSHANHALSPRHTQHAHHHASSGPIDFDPFSESHCCKVLSQRPEQNAAIRSDPEQLAHFRHWFCTHFPKVVSSFRALRLLPSRAVPQQQPKEPKDESAENSDEEDDEDSSGDDEESQEEVNDQSPQSTTGQDHRRHQAQSQAWAWIFQHATLISAIPGEEVVSQDRTASGNAYFVLNGRCDLVFHAKFIAFILAKRKEIQRQQQPHSTITAVRSFGTLSHTDDSLHASRRISLMHLSDQAAQRAIGEQLHLRTLSSGDAFGLEAGAFEFPCHLVSAISNGAFHRTEIGITTQGCMYVLVLPFTICERIRNCMDSVMGPITTPPTAAASPQTGGRRRRAVMLATPRTFPFTFDSSDVEFLRQTFLFQSMKESNLQFLASQLQLTRIPKHEYLFTTGQSVAVYLVKTGELKVSTLEQVRVPISNSDRHSSKHDMKDSHDYASSPPGDSTGLSALTTLETRTVDLEILQKHDAIGLMEACLLQPTFTHHCIATTDDVHVYSCSVFALLSVLSQERTASAHVLENLTRHSTWYKLRQFTALNHHNTQTEFKLSLSVQNKSPLQCSRCGWTGHGSTSSICVRAESLKSTIRHQVARPQRTSKNGSGIHPVGTRSSRTQRRISSLTATDQNQPSRASRHASMVSVDPESVSEAPQGHHNRTGGTLFSAASLLLPFLSIQNEELKCQETTETRGNLERALTRLEKALSSVCNETQAEPKRASTAPSSQAPSSSDQGVRPATTPAAAATSVIGVRQKAMQVVVHMGNVSSSRRAQPSPPQGARRGALLAPSSSRCDN